MKVKVTVEYELNIELAEDLFLEAGRDDKRALRVVTIEQPVKPVVIPSYEDSDGEMIFKCEECGAEGYDLLDHECDVREFVEAYFDVAEPVAEVGI